MTIYHTQKNKGQVISVGIKINTRRIKVMYENEASSTDEEVGTCNRQRKLKVKSDYLLIGVEHHASTFMTNITRHFIGPLKPISNRVVKAYGGVIKVIGEGTVKCNIEDDDEQIHSIIIHKVNYLPEDPVLLIYPKNWFQQDSGNQPKTDGTWCNTKAKNCIL